MTAVQRCRSRQGASKIALTIGLLVQENEALIAKADGLRSQIAEPREATAAMVQAGALAFSPNEVLPTEVEADVMSRVYHAMEKDRVAQHNGS
ncbi:hypothetical protein [Rhizobium sp. NFR03]|uniref:hypothetical protein n=1 Tax=Rhizobium sp. NFR03 TaxID=1566263 RepID=UPI000B813692|nr:hypothetical protein [Rhizobium sp. NFR03]